MQIEVRCPLSGGAVGFFPGPLFGVAPIEPSARIYGPEIDYAATGSQLLAVPDQDADGVPDLAASVQQKSVNYPLSVKTYEFIPSSSWLPPRE